MNRRKLFLAYCSNQRDLALRYQAALSPSFDVVPWENAQDAGSHILESILKAIRGCAYGLAILSCDDTVRVQDKSKKSVKKPRDNVILEVGLMIGLYGRARTAVVSVQDAGGDWPTVPSDFRGILHERHFASPADLAANNFGDQEAVLKHNVTKIEYTLLHKISDYIPTCSSTLDDTRGFNVLKMQDIVSFWAKYHGEFYCINPSWENELVDDKWLQSHYERYMNPLFERAYYVVDIDRGRQNDADDAKTDGLNRRVDPNRDLTGLYRFTNKMVERYPDVENNLNAKMCIYIRPGVRSELTSFVGTLGGIERAFLFIRRVNKDTVLEARSAQIVESLRRRAVQLVNHASGDSPESLEDLRRRLVIQTTL